MSNEPIYAAAPGKVLLAEGLGGGWEPYGNSVFIEHQNGYRTLYAHLNTIDVAVNDYVDNNTQIGTAGQSGSGASSNHLHFVLYNGTNVAGDGLGNFGPSGGSAAVPEPFASCTQQSGGDCEDIAQWDYLRRDDFAPEAVVHPDGALELFTCARNTQALLHRRREANGNWGSWKTLGGTCAGDPTAARDDSGRVFVFVRGLNGNLYYQYRTSSTSAWVGWGSLSGPVVGRAAVALDDAYNKLRVFARKHNDNALYSASQYTTTFSSWTRLGGKLLNSPVAGTRSDQRVDAFVAGDDYQLWKMPANSNGTFAAGNWHSQGGMKIQGEPDLVTEGDLEWVVHSIFDQLQVAPGVYVSSGTHPPAAARKTNDRLHVFVRDRYNSNADYFYETSSGGWSGSTLGGLVTSELEAVRAGSGNKLIFFTWGTGGLYYRELGTSTGNTNWGNWVDLNVPN